MGNHASCWNNYNLIPTESKHLNENIFTPNASVH